MAHIKFEVDHHPKTEDDQIIKDGIIQFNSNILREKASHFSIFVKNEDDIIGGALIWEHSDALYIDTLWIREGFRQQKIGSKILSMIEEHAKNKLLHKIFVDTFAFQVRVTLFLSSFSNECPLFICSVLDNITRLAL